MRADLPAFGDDLDTLVGIPRPRGAAIRAALGYPASGPHDLADTRLSAASPRAGAS